jgi:hypothetical protein
MKGATTNNLYELKHAFEFIKDLTGDTMYNGTRAAILRLKNTKK